MENKPMKVVAIIAVRLKSTRIPEKALADIDGLPMFVHTCKRAALAKSVDAVYLATDDEHIRELAQSYAIPVIMTATHHTNSSERIAEACLHVDAEIILNIQGDEPLVYPEHIDQVVAPMLHDASIPVTIGVTKFYKRNRPGCLKAVLNPKNQLLYASRNDIPCYYRREESFFWKLCFIVAFKKEIIRKYAEWEPTPLELIEDNHFMRLTENEIPILAVEIENAKVSVDTPEDLIEVRELMQYDTLKNTYLSEFEKA